MLAVAKQTDVEMFQNILAEKEAEKRQLAELRGRNEALEATIAQLQEDMKNFEQFRPILEQPLIDFYSVKLSGSAMLKTLLARMTKMYGKRFQLEGEDGQERRFARQRMSEVVTNCVRYCVMQNSRWNDMVAHFMSET
jgi:hypothetical protein